MSSSSAIVLAGLELRAGEEPQALTPDGALPPSAVVTLTRATLVVTGKADANAPQFLVKANINEDQAIVLCSLSPSQPSAGLDLVFHADSTPTFSVEQADGKVSDKYSVHMSGYVEVSDEDEDDEVDEDEMESMMEELGNEEEDEDDEVDNDEQDDENDEDDEGPAVPQGNKRKAPAASVDDDEEVSKPASKAQKVATPSKPAAQQSKPQASPAQPKHTTVKRADGLELTDEVIGSGAEAKGNKNVTIRYKGELTNGKVFDSNMPRGQPFSFRLGAGECIPGFDAGVKGMKVGGRRILVIPPQLGYGKKGSPPQIPPNATLKFTIELIKA